MLVRLPRILGNGPLEIQPLIRLHLMHVLAHGTVWIPLDHEIDIPLCILVADGRIRPYDRLVHLRALVLCQQRRGDGEARDVIAVGEREAEFLGVVVEFLDGFELEVDEALVSAREGLLRSGCRRSGGGGHGLAFVCRRGGLRFWFRVGFFGGIRNAVVVVSSS